MPLLTRPLDDEEKNEIAAAAQRGLSRLAVSADAPPDEVVRIAEATLEQEMAKGGKKLFGLFRGKPAAPADPGALATEIGAVWGMQLQKAVGWDWAMAQRGEDAEFALISKDREYAVFPVTFVKRTLAEPGEPLTLHFLFDAIRRGRIVPAERGVYDDLTDGRYKPEPAKA